MAPTTTTQHGSLSRYRSGCRCTDCRIAHADDLAIFRFERLYGDGAPMGPETRSRILASLRKTRSVIATAKALGMAHQSIYGACRSVPEFGEQVDKLTRVENE